MSDATVTGEAIRRHLAGGHAARGPQPAVLETRGLSRHFGGVAALTDLDLAVAPGTVTAVIGPNGAGKTTLFNLLTGVLRPSGGGIRFLGREVAGKPPHAVAALGMARTFQNLQLFPQMTVLETVQVGREARRGAGFLGALFRPPPVVRAERAAREAAWEQLALIGLADRADDLATSLPFGQQRLLEIARALATEPALLLLDEPAAGLSAGERAALARLVGDIRAAGVTTLLVEHDMAFVMRLADRVAVLNFGAKIADDSPAAVQRDPAVIAAYLGEEE